MGSKEENPYYVWGKQIGELKKDIELVLYSCGIYDWPETDQEFSAWVDSNENINEANKSYIQSKMNEVFTLEKNISDSLRKSLDNPETEN